jgi:AcrR family transcriptional regulator
MPRRARAGRPRGSGRKPAWKPRKLPAQARSQATFDAILEAAARILREAGLAAVTTNAVAQRAGVGIGSLYEFFPSRLAILATLAERRLARLAEVVESALAEAQALDAATAVQLLVERLVAAVTADRALFRVLLREAPMLRDLPETRRAVDAFFALGRVAAERAGARIDLPAPDADVWLIGRMVANAVLEIAFLDAPEPDRDVLVEELARLTFRMLRGRDIDAPMRRRGARARR